MVLKPHLLIGVLSVAIQLVSCECDDCDGFDSPREKTILQTNFGMGGTPGLHGWTYAGVADTPFVNDRRLGWSLALEANTLGGEVAWFDFDSLGAGIYEISVQTRAIPGLGDVVPNGRIQLGLFNEVFCGPDTAWHRVTMLDTLEARNTAMHLYGGMATKSGSTVLFNEVSVLKLP